jgi:hypothetical protein
MLDFACLTANARLTNALAQMEQLQVEQPVLKTEETFVHPAKLASTWPTPLVRLMSALARTEMPLQEQRVKQTTQQFAKVALQAFI